MRLAEKIPPERTTDPTTELLSATDQHKDPVCSMWVDPSHAAGSVVHDGRTYYFCLKSCQQKFTAEPAKFTADTLQSAACLPSTGGTIYTCPMHPKTVRDGAALFSIGIPKNSVVQYETEVKAGKLLLVVHGTADAVESARDLLHQS